MAEFYVLLLEGVPAALEEDLTNLLFEFGAQGVSENLAFEQTVQQFEPVLLPAATKNLAAYFLEPPAEELKASLSQAPFGILPQGSGGSAPTWSLIQEPERDWLQEWKKGYTSFELTPGFWIVPRWEEVPAGAQISFRLEPGMAFGTGTHETTQLVAERMALLPPANSFLDVGTGTGLLAFFALKQGYPRVVGIDTDPEALRVASENLSFNGASEVEISQTPLDQIQEEFDVVAANIIQSVLVHLRGALIQATRPGGLLILSGILKDHESEFAAEFFFDQVLKVVDRSMKGDWVCLTAQRQVSR